MKDLKLRWIVTMLAVLFVAAVATSSVPAQADDSDQPPQFPNRMQVNPRATEEPGGHVVAIPERESQPGSPLSPNSGSQMGLGIQIPFGKPTPAVPQMTPQLKKKKPTQPAPEPSGDE